LSWTLYHVIATESPLYGLDADGMAAAKISLMLVVSGYDVVAAQTVHARRAYDHFDVLFGKRYVDIFMNSDDGQLKIDYSLFHETLAE
jgi:inward rectifier potassium channel